MITLSTGLYNWVTFFSQLGRFRHDFWTDRKNQNEIKLGLCSVVENIYVSKKYIPYTVRPRLRREDYVKNNAGGIKPEIPWRVVAEDRDRWWEICLAVWSQWPKTKKKKYIPYTAYTLSNCVWKIKSILRRLLSEYQRKINSYCFLGVGGLYLYWERNNIQRIYIYMKK